jgi:hypothetical protein
MSSVSINSGTIEWFNKAMATTNVTSVANLFIGRVISGGGTTITVALTVSSGASAAGYEITSDSKLVRIDRTSFATATSTSADSGSCAASTSGQTGFMFVGVIAAKNQPTYSAQQINGGSPDATALYDTSTIGTSNDRAIDVFYTIVSSAGTPKATATLASQAWVAGCVTLEETPTAAAANVAGFLVQ